MSMAFNKEEREREREEGVPWQYSTQNKCKQFPIQMTSP